MKSFWIPLATLALSLTITGCGKKAEVKDPESQDKNIAPSTAEVNFYILKEMKRTVYENDLGGLKKVLKENPNIDLNAIMNDGDTYLTVAIKKDFRDIRNYLIEKGASVERVNINKNTPLLVAVSKGMVNTVKVLLDYKVDLEKRNNEGDTALHIAIKNSQDEIAQLLIKQGANVEALDGKNRSAIRLAEDYNVPLALELLKSVLQVEVGAPDIASFRSILTQGDLKRLNNVLTRYPRLANDYESINPLALLVEVKDENTAMRSAELLLNYEANVNGPKDAEVTPLIQATLTEKQKFANLYLSSNANPQLLDKEGKSALIHAVELNNLEMVNLLLSFSAVEKYTFRRDGKKITYSACDTARDAFKDLKTVEEKKMNEKIKDSLDCGFLRWLF
jgi:ankyrin repeat protein/predicted small lipoprotein YifL